MAHEAMKSEEARQGQVSEQLVQLEEAIEKLTQSESLCQMSDEIRLSANASIILEDREVLSDVEITSDYQVGQATVAELAESARQHYEVVSRRAHEWYSLIPDAIDAWEREQERLARPSLLDALRRRLRRVWAASAVMVCPECYAGGGWEPGACEGCRAREGCETVILL